MPVTHPRRTFTVAVLVGLTLIASACASGASDPTGGARDDDAVTGSPSGPAGATGDRPDGDAPSSDPAAVPTILDFEAPLVGGGTLEGAELAGAPVAVWFWAPW